ncbi:MAG: hypothetical protein JJE39_11060 [Vicinamibacteria bacterium]|nr:hypothetical protein [Vicinamibacteria bacterium]
MFGALVYIGVEPILRKALPRALVSWTRLISGRLRDPLVGRDVLVGVSVAALVVLIRFAGAVLPPSAGGVPALRNTWAISALASPWQIPAALLIVPFYAALTALFSLAGYVVNLAIFRRRDLAVLSLWGIFAMVSLARVQGIAGALLELLWFTILLWVLLQVGVLAMTVTVYSITILIHLPLATDLSVWYAGRAAVGLLVIFGLAVYGFVIALAGKPMFGRPVLDV